MSLHLLHRSYFLPLKKKKKRREKVVYLPRKERAYITASGAQVSSGVLAHASAFPQ